MDKIADSGSVDVGSTPAGNTDRKADMIFMSAFFMRDLLVTIDGDIIVDDAQTFHQAGMTIPCAAPIHQAQAVAL
jgi:hypothetical protein